MLFVYRTRCLREWQALSELRFKQVACGHTFTLAVTTDGKARFLSRHRVITYPFIGLVLFVRLRSLGCSPYIVVSQLYGWGDREGFQLGDGIADKPSFRPIPIAIGMLEQMCRHSSLTLLSLQRSEFERCRAARVTLWRWRKAEMYVICFSPSSGSTCRHSDSCVRPEHRFRLDIPFVPCRCTAGALALCMTATMRSASGRRSLCMHRSRPAQSRRSRAAPCTLCCSIRTACSMHGTRRFLCSLVLLFWSVSAFRL